jgi:DNA repair protein RAD50
MLIKGIRSFSPENRISITFYKPLTLIVGHNGAGKTVRTLTSSGLPALPALLLDVCRYVASRINTAHLFFVHALTVHVLAKSQTVIECLKMVCTGELPPNTRSGQNFIHDPKVAGETEVKALIKLRFYTAQGQPYTVIRAFQLTQKKTSLQFKTLDSSLSTLDPETGEMATVPNRCSDINAAVPVTMGVTKAILENVIFVHQEESNWPLAEGKVLKGKFDDIFAATKYTKALEELRRIRSNNSKEEKLMRARLETTKAKKDVAARLRTTAAENSRRADMLRSEIENLDTALAAVIAERSAVMTKLNSMADVGDEMTHLKARYETLAAKNAEMYARLAAAYLPEDLESSEAELSELQQSIGPALADLQRAIQALERDQRAAELNAAALRDQRDRDMASHARLVAEADAHKRNIIDRDNFLRKIAAEAGGTGGTQTGSFLATNSSPLSTEAVAELRAVFQKRLSAASAELEAARERHLRQDEEAGREVDAVLGEIRAATDGVRMKEEAVQSNMRRVQQLQEQIDGNMGADKDSLDAAISVERTAEERLHAKEAELAGSTLEEESRDAAAALAALSRRAEQLRAERAQLAGAAEEATRMNLKAQELTAAEKKAASQLNQWRPQLAMILGLAPAEVPSPGPALTSTFQQILDSRRQGMQVASTALKEAQTQATLADASANAIEEQLTKAKNELEQLSQRLSAQVSAGKSVPEELVALEKVRMQQSQRVQTTDAMQQIYSAQIQFAQQHATCSTCHRQFESTQQRDAVVQRLEQELASVPSKHQEVQAQLAEAEARLKMLRELEPLAIRHDTLRDAEIPALQSRLAQLKANAAGLRVAAETTSTEHEHATSAFNQAQSTMSDVVAPLARAAQDIAHRRQEVESLRSSVRILNATRTVADVDNDLADVDAERVQFEHVKDTAASNLAKLRDEVAMLRTEVHNARESVLRLRAAVEKRAAAEAQLAELTAQSEAMVSEVMRSKNMAAPLQERKAVLDEARHRARRAAAEESRRLEASLRGLQTQETQLEARERALTEYEHRGGASALSSAESRLSSLKERQTEAEQKARHFAEELVSKKQEASESDALARQIAETMAYKRSKSEEAAVAGELDAKGVMLAQVGDRNALQARAKDLEAEERRLQSEADKKAGALGQVRQVAGEAARELSDATYDNIDEKYRLALIEVETTAKATDDLEKFHKALEKALLAYHTTKMADINKIIKELWQKTYRGTDIDYIQIRADTESGTAARSYNYRVVMMCGGAELDMRGRCSAGQRVLACLVIRLALAETFCLNCGILALDEPTTNLDADNAASLADSLKAIMLARREQENFQLIVITHDEAFARAIGTREHAEYMWRITKDDSQHSTLHQEEILE